MPPYKRTNPKEQAAQRAKILADMEQRKNVPQADRMFPNLIEKGRRAFVGAVDQARKRRRPPPRVEGAKVAGFGPGRNDA